MRFAEPARIVAIDRDMARVAGVDREFEVSLAVLRSQRSPVATGDWVLVALGLALEVVDDATGRRMLDDRTAHEPVAEPAWGPR